MKAKLRERKLRDLWMDPRNPLGYSGDRERFYRAARASVPGLTRRQTNDFFSGMSAYTSRARARYRYKKRRTPSYGWLDLAQADLLEMPRLAWHNEGYKYVLIVVDVLSKYLWTVPLKTKKAEEVAKAFEKVFSALPDGRSFVRIQTDKGLEFFGAPTRKAMKARGVIHFASEQKAYVAEAFVKKMKYRLYRYLEANRTRNWSRALADLTHGMNESVFAGHGFKPSQVNEKNEGEVFRKLFPMLARGLRRYPLRWRYSVGQRVKIAIDRSKLWHSFYRTWSEDDYVIHSRLATDPVTYLIRNLEGGPAKKGAVYEEELQPAKEPVS